MKRLRSQLVAVTLVVGGLLVARHVGTSLTHVADNGTGGQSADVCDDDSCDLVVDFKDDVPHEQLAALQKQLGIKLRPVSAFVDADEIYTIGASELGRSPNELLAILRTLPEVEAAELDVNFTIPETELNLTTPVVADPSHKDFPNDPKFSFQWHMQQLHIKDAWKV